VIDISFISGVLLGACYGWLFTRRMQRFVIGDKGNQAPPASKYPWGLIVSFLGSYGLLFAALWLLLTYANINLALSLMGFGLGFGPVVYLQVRRLP
jgi:hypothetical protein